MVKTMRVEILHILFHFFCHVPSFWGKLTNYPIHTSLSSDKRLLILKNVLIGLLLFDSAVYVTTRSQFSIGILTYICVYLTHLISWWGTSDSPKIPKIHMFLMKKRLWKYHLTFSYILVFTIIWVNKVPYSKCLYMLEEHCLLSLSLYKWTWL